MDPNDTYVLKFSEEVAASLPTSPHVIWIYRPVQQLRKAKCTGFQK